MAEYEITPFFMNKDDNNTRMIVNPKNNQVELTDLIFTRELYDTCVFCGIETQYRKENPVDMRAHYIDGAGQLCSDCYKDVYG